MKFSIYFCLILTFGQLQKNVTTCPFRRVVKIIHNESFFFLSGFSFTNILDSQTLRNSKEGIRITMGYGELMKFADICVAEINPLHQGYLAGLRCLNLSLFIVNKFYSTNPPHVFHVDMTWKRSLRLKCVTICRAKCLDMVTLKVLPTSRFRYNSYM